LKPILQKYEEEITKEEVRKNIIKQRPIDEKVDIDRIVEAIKPFYKPGYRHYISLGVAGLCAQMGLSPRVATKIVGKLVLATDDEEIKDRIRAIVDTYSLMGMYDENVKEEIAKVLEELGLPNVVPNASKRSEKPASRHLWEAVRAQLEQAGVDENEIKATLTKLKSELRKAMGIRSRVTLYLGKNKYLVIDFIKGESAIYKVTYDEDEDGNRRPEYELHEKIMSLVPIELTYGRDIVSKDSVDIMKLYDPWRNEVFEITEVGSEIKGWEIIVQRALVRDKRKYYNMLKEVLKEVGLATFKKWIATKPGYFTDPETGKIIVGGPEPTLPTREELKEAIIAEYALSGFYEDPLPYIVVMQWAKIAPLSRVIREVRNRTGILPLEGIILYGISGTGKSTLARIAVAMWKDHPAYDWAWASGVGGVNSEATFAEHMRKWTFPIVINEPDRLLAGLERGDGTEAVLKNAIDSLYVRNRTVKVGDGAFTNVEMPSLAIPLMTTNYVSSLQISQLKRRYFILELIQPIPKHIKEAFADLEPAFINSIASWGRFLHHAFKHVDFLLDKVKKPEELASIFALAGAFYAGILPPRHYFADFTRLRLGSEDFFAEEGLQFFKELIALTGKVNIALKGKVEKALEELLAMAQEGGYSIEDIDEKIATFRLTVKLGNEAGILNGLSIKNIKDELWLVVNPKMLKVDAKAIGFEFTKLPSRRELLKMAKRVFGEENVRRTRVAINGKIIDVVAINFAKFVELLLEEEPEFDEEEDNKIRYFDIYKMSKLAVELLQRMGLKPQIDLEEPEPLIRKWLEEHGWEYDWEFRATEPVYPDGTQSEQSDTSSMDSELAEEIGRRKEEGRETQNEQIDTSENVKVPEGGESDNESNGADRRGGDVQKTENREESMVGTSVVLEHTGDSDSKRLDRPREVLRKEDGQNNQGHADVSTEDTTISEDNSIEDYNLGRLSGPIVRRKKDDNLREEENRRGGKVDSELRRAEKIVSRAKVRKRRRSNQ
jgi:hypothetical protein